MTRKIRNQFGFTGLEVVLMLALTAVLVGGGVYVYTQRTQNAQKQAASSPSPAPVVPKGPTAADAAAYVKDFYTSYIDSLHQDTADNFASQQASRDTLVKSHLTSDFYSQYTANKTQLDYDQVSCVNADPPASFTIASQKSTGNGTFEVKVDEKGTNGPDIVVTVSVKDDSGLKISGFQCPTGQQ
jgi:hypothetical protein